MADMPPSSPPMPSASPPSPGGPPGGAAPGKPGFGSSPASAPNQPSGQQAAGLARLTVIIRLMEQTLPLLTTGTAEGKELVKCMTALSKFAPEGATTPGLQQSTMQRLMAQQQQQGPQIQAMRSGGPLPPGGGAVPPGSQ